MAPPCTFPEKLAVSGVIKTVIVNWCAGRSMDVVSTEYEEGVSVRLDGDSGRQPVTLPLPRRRNYRYQRRHSRPHEAAHGYVAPMRALVDRKSTRLNSSH